MRYIRELSPAAEVWWLSLTNQITRTLREPGTIHSEPERIALRQMRGGIKNVNLAEKWRSRHVGVG